MSLNVYKMSEKELKDWVDDKRSLPEWVIKKASRPLIDQLVEDQTRVKNSVKMTIEDLLHSSGVIGYTKFISKGTDPDAINRADTYLLCKQLLTALRVGRFCNIDHDDVEWALHIAELRLGGAAVHISQAMPELD